MKYIKTLESFDDIIVGKIRYSDDKGELETLTKMGVKYVLREGDTKIAYYELDYNYTDYDGNNWVDKYGYAPLGNEIPNNFFEGKKIKFIDSIYTTIKKYNL